MNRSEYKNFAAMSPEAVTFTAMLQGAGAAPPVFPPTAISVPNTSSKSYMAATNNYASPIATDVTRAGVGSYTAKLKDSIPVVFDVDPNVWGPNGTTATIVDYNPQTRVITFLTWGPTGTAVDLAATEFIRFTFFGQLSVI